MSDLWERYRALLRTPTPNLWHEITTREPRVGPDTKPRGHRVVVVVVSLAIATAGLIPLLRAFDSGRDHPLGSTLPTIHPRIVASFTVAPTGQGTDVFSAAGSVWVAAYGVQSEQDHLLRRIDPASNEIVADVHLEGTPGWETGGGGIAFGSGSLWVVGIRSTSDGREAILQRVDLSVNRVLATIPLFGTTAWDVAVNDAGVWVASSTDDRAELGRVDPATNEVVARVPLAHSYVRRVVATEDVVVVEEKVWPDEPPYPLTVIETLDPKTNSSLGRSQSWAEAGEIVVWGGQVWATSPGGGFQLVDAENAAPVGDVVAREASPCCYLVAASTDGIWYFEKGYLSLLNPQASQVIGALSMPDNPVTAAATTEDSVWVLGFDGRLTRVDVQ